MLNIDIYLDNALGTLTQVSRVPPGRCWMKEAALPSSTRTVLSALSANFCYSDPCQGCNRSPDLSTTPG